MAQRPVLTPVTQTGVSVVWRLHCWSLDTLTLVWLFAADLQPSRSVAKSQAALPPLGGLL